MKKIIGYISKYFEIVDMDVIFKENKIEIWFSVYKEKIIDSENIVKEYINSLDLPPFVEVIFIKEEI